MPALAFTKKAYWLCLVFLTLSLLFFWTKTITDRTYEQSKEREAIYEKTFGTLPLETKIAYVYDLTDERAIYAKNEKILAPLASFTKLMTTVVVFENISKNSTITLSDDALSTEGEYGLVVGEKWRASDLARFMLIASSNDAAHALELATASPASFVSAMNRKSAELGLSMHFKNETGLDLETAEESAFGSAEDSVKLFAYALKTYPDILSATGHPSLTVTSESGTVHTVDNTDPILASLPSPIASKTGYTLRAGGNLLVAFSLEGHTIITCVLGSSQDGRFSDTLALAYASELYFSDLRAHGL